jgi:hypothetical protein
LIVDGQQRLTSLFSVLTGSPVGREEHSESRISIAFRPQNRTFEVADAAIEQDPELPLPKRTRSLQPSCLMGAFDFCTSGGAHRKRATTATPRGSPQALSARLAMNMVYLNESRTSSTVVCLRTVTSSARSSRGTRDCSCFIDGLRETGTLNNHSRPPR